MPKKMCFVVMGFGKKVDYSDPTDKPRTLDLDATYGAISKPAVLEAGLDCIRADEISHSGIIDKMMFEMLLRADLVIADISTANPNALYELGVRHALRPRTTIVIKDVDGKFIFDLNHLATLQYKHLGEDIGAREAKAKTLALRQLIEKVMETQDRDSPVYTYLDDLQEPMMSRREFAQAIADAKAKSDTLCKEIDEARGIAARAGRQEDHARARDHFARALALQTRPREGISEPIAPDPFLVQQLALQTYKAELPDAVSALRSAWLVLDPLRPETSTDPETLGIGGAIQKRLWERTRDPVPLDLAIELYGRGFEVKRDYYNGENYAQCLDMRAGAQNDPGEADYDRRTARKVRERVVAALELAFQDETTKDRSDYPWMLATMANVGYALARGGAEAFEAAFRALAPAPWAIATFEKGKTNAVALAQGALDPVAAPANAVVGHMFGLAADALGAFGLSVTQRGPPTPEAAGRPAEGPGGPPERPTGK